MRCALVALASFVLSTVVISNTYYRKKQFYPTVVYLTNHQPCLAILLFQCVVILFIFTKALTYIFFGRLQRTEIDNLVSQSWYAFFDLCLVFAFFQDELGTEFMFLFAILLFVRTFHWLVEERIDYMERTPVINALFHVRIITLLILLALVDGYYIKTAYWKPAMPGVTVHLALGVEYFILLLNIFSTTVRYILHSIDSMREHSWDKKAMYLLYVDIFIGLIRLAIYVEFTFIMWSLHPFPLFIIRPIYLSVRSLKKSIRDVLMSRRAIRYMNTVFKDATTADLTASSDTVCIICREEMTLQMDANTSVRSSVLKKLPCSHIFHVVCLRSWFQRQQTCPTCRMDVIRQARQQELQGRQPRRTSPTTSQSSSSTVNVTSSSNVSTTSTVGTSGSQIPWIATSNTFPYWGSVPSFTSTTPTSHAQNSFPTAPPPFVMPPFMGMPIIYPGNLFPNLAGPMPQPPETLSQSAQEETHLRASAEARLSALRQINILLNAAILQMNAYLNSVTMGPPCLDKSVALTVTTNSAVSVNHANNIRHTHLTEFVNVEPSIKREVLNATSVPVNEFIEENDPNRDSFELDEVRKRRLEHFCNSNQPATISQTDEETINGEKE